MWSDLEWRGGSNTTVGGLLSRLLFWSRIWNSAVLKTDLLTAIGWVKDDSFGNLARVDVIYDIRASLRRLNNPSLNFVPRASNSMADGLAKRGLASNGVDVVWNFF